MNHGKARSNVSPVKHGNRVHRVSHVRHVMMPLTTPAPSHQRRLLQTVRVPPPEIAKATVVVAAVVADVVVVNVGMKPVIRLQPIRKTWSLPKSPATSLPLL
jgi:hypothetical protein